MNHDDPWLPRGHELPGGVRCQRMRASGDEWQIYDSDADGRLLVASQTLGERWEKTGLLKAGRFHRFDVGDRDLIAIHSAGGYRLSEIVST